MLAVLDKVLSPAIRLPSSPVSKENMTICFQHFQNVGLVLDSTEVLNQKPKYLYCCTYLLGFMFYSRYKVNQTHHSEVYD